jgi:hypothetical protein
VRCPPPLLRKDSLLAKHVEAQLAGIVQAKAPPAARKRGWLLFGGAKAAIEPDASSLKTGRVPTTTKVGAQAQTKTPLDAAISDIQARVKKVFEDSEKRGGEVERDPWPLGTLVAPSRGSSRMSQASIPRSGVPSDSTTGIFR